MWTHPITSEEFADRPAYIQSLADSYAKAKKELYQWGQDEAKLVQALNDVVSEEVPALEHGKHTLQGVTDEVVVQRKLNATYPKDKGADHPLRQLLPKFDDLGNMIRIDYKESGNKIQGLVDRYYARDLRPNDNPDLAEELAKLRQTKAGKPTITIERKATDVPETEGAQASVEF